MGLAVVTVIVGAVTGLLASALVKMEIPLRIPAGIAGGVAGSFLGVAIATAFGLGDQLAHVAGRRSLRRLGHLRPPRAGRGVRQVRGVAMSRVGFAGLQIGGSQ